jgi:hypothetical protein
VLELYRLAWTSLKEWQNLQNKDLDYWIDELREALLDLKQATLRGDEIRALEYVDEIKILIAELVRRTKGHK